MKCEIGSIEFMAIHQWSLLTRLNHPVQPVEQVQPVFTVCSGGEVRSVRYDGM